MMAGAWPGDPLILMVLGILALGALAVLLDGLRLERRNPEGRDMEGAFAAPAHASDPVSQMAAIHRVMAVIEFDLQGRILTANQNFLDLFGCRLEEIRGQPHSIFCPPGVAHSQDYQELWERLRRGEHETGEYRRLALDGRELWVQASYHPLAGRARWSSSPATSASTARWRRSCSKPRSAPSGRRPPGAPSWPT